MLYMHLLLLSTCGATKSDPVVLLTLISCVVQVIIAGPPDAQIQACLEASYALILFAGWLMIDQQSVITCRTRRLQISKPCCCCCQTNCMSQVIIAGSPDAAETQALLIAAHAAYAPDRVVIPIDPSNKASTEWYKQHNPGALSMVEGASKEVCCFLSSFCSDCSEA